MTLALEIPLTEMDHRDAGLFRELLDAVATLAATGEFTGGEAVERFEHDFASWCEARHAVAVSSGTDALILTLRALGIGPGDEVVVPANSFIATAEAVSLVGARPSFADVDLASQLVTAETVERALSPATRCVIAVHLFGRTVDLRSIAQLAHERNLFLVEDAAQAHGARYRQDRVGTHGIAGTFSFYPAKNLGAWGDGGAVVTADARLAERVRLMRSHGERPRYHHRIVGTTARLDAIQATVLSVKLARLDSWNEGRRRVAAELREALRGTPLLPPPPPDADGDHVYHQFVARCAARDTLRGLLAERGIATGIHYPIPIHRSEAYDDLSAGNDVAPCATALARQIISLPIFPGMSPEQVRRIGDVARELGELPVGGRK